MYELPPPRVVTEFRSTTTHSAVAGPRVGQVAVLEWAMYTDIQTLGQPLVHVAGLKVDFRRRTGPWRPSLSRIALFDAVDGRAGPVVDLPRDSRWIGFSPGGAWIALTETTADGAFLTVLETETGALRRLASHRLNATLSPVARWRSETEILYKGIPHGNDAPPQRPAPSSGPVVFEAEAWRTASGLPSGRPSCADPAAFDAYLASQLVLTDVLSAQSQPIGAPAVIREYSVSPDGCYILVSRVLSPGPGNVSIDDCRQTHEIWDAHGAPIRTLAPVVPGAGALDCQSHWHPTEAATLVRVTTCPSGDEESVGSALAIASPPSFEEEACPAHFPGTIRRILWSHKGLGVVEEYDTTEDSTRLWTLASPRSEPEALMQHAGQAAIRFLVQHVRVSQACPRGSTSPAGLVHEGNRIFFVDGDPGGDSGYLDCVNLASRQIWRSFQSSPDVDEQPVAMVSADVLLTRRQSPSACPNYHSRHLVTGQSRPLTVYCAAPGSVEAAGRRHLSYRRRDGLALEGMLYVPADHTPGRPMPLVLWVYPESDPARSIRASRSQRQRFLVYDGLSPVYLLSQGFSVLLHPSMALAASEGDVHRSYVDQLLWSADAAIDACVGTGIVDPDRIGVGGVSYGAAAAASLLAHSDRFRAAVCINGAFNRTLTPFGFQHETRSFWEAKDAYLAMSPFMHADRIKAPVLFVHAEQDAHPGTPALQSERMFTALARLGVTTRLVLLPAEGHVLLGRESLLHAMAEVIQWFQAHLGRDAS